MTLLSRDYLLTYSLSMDMIFKALGDPARREILDALREQDGQSLSQLEDRFEMTRFGVMKHLGVLESAGLITTKKQGRFKYHYLNALPLQEAIDRWIEPLLVKPAARSLLDLKAQLESPTMLDTAPKPSFVMETFIRTTVDAVWDALIDPDQIMHYHFIAASAQGRLGAPGDTLTYLDGDGHAFLENTVTAATPKTRIEITFEPNWDEVKTKSSCVYVIQPRTDSVKLRVEHYDIPTEHGDGVAEGWARTLSGLKTWLETGQDVRFGFEGDVS